MLILLSFSGAVLAIRRFLLLRLEARIERALDQVIQELRVSVGGKYPETARPFGENITAIYDVFLLPDSFYDSVAPNLPNCDRSQFGYG